MIIYDEAFNKIGDMPLYDTRPRPLINDWFKRPTGGQRRTVVPLKTALTVSESVRLDSGPMDAFGYMLAPGNDVQHVTHASVWSACFANANGSFITADNFDRAMISVAVRRAVVPSWINDRDQFRIPQVMP
jgi:hypothetical protein